MRNAIVALLIFTASVAQAQFTGGVCPSGGFVDRYSDQSVSGKKTFCSTATFNSGFALGLNPVNTLGLTALQAPTGRLYWGNKEVCDTSGNCPGVGPSLPPDFPDDYLRFLVPGGPGGTVNRLSIFDSTFTITDSVIEQDDGADTIVFNDFYSLTMVSTSSIPTIYSATGVDTTQDFIANTTGKLTLKASSQAQLEGTLEAIVTAGDSVIIHSDGDMELSTADNLQVSATHIQLTGATISVNGIPVLPTATFNGGDCGGGNTWKLTIVGGMATSIICSP